MQAYYPPPGHCRNTLLSCRCPDFERSPASPKCDLCEHELEWHLDPLSLDAEQAQAIRDLGEEPLECCKNRRAGGEDCPCPVFVKGEGERVTECSLCGCRKGWHKYKASGQVVGGHRGAANLSRHPSTSYPGQGYPAYDSSPGQSQPQIVDGYPEQLSPFATSPNQQDAPPPPSSSDTIPILHPLLMEPPLAPTTPLPGRMATPTTPNPPLFGGANSERSPMREIYEVPQFARFVDGGSTSTSTTSFDLASQFHPPPPPGLSLPSLSSSTAPTQLAQFDQQRMVGGSSPLFGVPSITRNISVGGRPAPVNPEFYSAGAIPNQHSILPTPPSSSSSASSPRPTGHRRPAPPPPAPSERRSSSAVASSSTAPPPPPLPLPPIPHSVSAPTVSQAPSEERNVPDLSNSNFGNSTRGISEGMRMMMGLGGGPSSLRGRTESTGEGGGHEALPFGPPSIRSQVQSPAVGAEELRRWKDYQSKSMTLSISPPLSTDPAAKPLGPGDKIHLRLSLLPGMIVAGFEKIEVRLVGNSLVYGDPPDDHEFLASSTVIHPARSDIVVFHDGVRPSYSWTIELPTHHSCDCQPLRPPLPSSFVHQKFKVSYCIELLAKKKTRININNREKVKIPFRFVIPFIDNELQTTIPGRDPITTNGVDGFWKTVTLNKAVNVEGGAPIGVTELAWQIFPSTDLLTPSIRIPYRASLVFDLSPQTPHLNEMVLDQLSRSLRVSLSRRITLRESGRGRGAVVQLVPAVRVAAKDSREESEVVTSGMSAAGQGQGRTTWRAEGTLELAKVEGKGLKTCNVWVQHNLTAHAPATAGLSSDIILISSNLNLDVPAGGAPMNVSAQSPRSEMSAASIASHNIPPLQLDEPLAPRLVLPAGGEVAESSGHNSPTESNVAAVNVGEHIGNLSNLGTSPSTSMTGRRSLFSRMRSTTRVEPSQTRRGSDSTEEEHTPPPPPPPPPIAGPSHSRRPSSTHSAISFRHDSQPIPIPDYHSPSTRSSDATTNATTTASSGPLTPAQVIRNRGMGIELPPELEGEDMGEYEPPPTFEEAIEQYATMEWEGR